MRHVVPLARIKFSLASDWSLDAAEVESRRIQFGANDIIEGRHHRWKELALDTAKDPMIWFLIVTSFIFASLKFYNQAIILFFAIIPLTGMDAFLHWRTQMSTQGLSTRLAAKANVIRHHMEMTVPAWEIVPGDLVIIATGSLFPADGIIVAGNHLRVDESTLTGESFPVEKQIITSFPNETDPAIENTYWGFAGTRLLTGRALLRVVYTGKETLYGEIATSALQSTQERTPLQKEIYKLVLTLILAATLFCVILAAVRYYQGFGAIDALLSAATLAVAALPDEFPVVFTFFLGVGIYRLATKKALVKRAVSVENIGRITAICSDKTGTITEGHFQLVRYLPADSFDDATLLLIANVASRKESGDLLDFAIADAAALHQIADKPRLTTFPFTEERKRETAITRIDANQLLVATKGAPETILAISSLSQTQHQHWLLQARTLAASGYKIIACAKQNVETLTTDKEPEKDYQFVGLLAFSDPPREGVALAVEQCRQSGIHVLMITGDHPETARAIATEIGLGQGQPRVVNAEDCAAQIVAKDGAYFRTLDVIARAVPAQKLGIVEALQSSGEIVAVTGDGVNDVPAIKTADIGIAMGERGTQSAREVADIVLLDDNFDSIVNAIAEGRQLFKNLQSSFEYLLLIHIPFVLSAAIIPLFGYPLLYYPIHIVFIELMIHPTSMLVFQDLPQSSPLARITRSKRIRFFTPKDWLKIGGIGLFSTIIITLSFILVLHQTENVESARALAFGALAMTSAALTLGLSGFVTTISRIVILGTVFLTLLLIQTPLLAASLSMQPLEIAGWLFIVMIGALTAILAKL